MFWIGFIVGMVVLALIYIGWIKFCCKILGINREDFHNFSDSIDAAIENRDSRIEVYSESTNEKVFEAGFKYPWGDNVEE